MSVDSKMTAIADEIRTLSGTTGTMGLDAMANILNTENTNFSSNLSTQDSLISQIQTALRGKTSGGTADLTLQTKTVTPSTSAQTVTPDSGYDGLSEVTVNAMPTATQATPTVSIDSAGKITASATQTAGYVSAGTKSGTKQLTTQAAKTITPSTSSQTAVEKNVYTTGVVTVAAIPSTYVKPTATKAATAYTPSTSDQTISAGTYCSGVQTIKGDANLVASNIAEGVSIFGITGTHSGGGSGGGDTVEICTGRIAYGDLLNHKNPLHPACYYTGNDLSVKTFTATEISTECTAIKGSLLYIADTKSATVYTCTNATLISNTSTGKLFSIDADVFQIVCNTM